MKKIIKGNWFKIGLLILVSIILVYLFLYMAGQNKKDTLSDNIKCQQVGMSLHKVEQEELIENFPGTRNEMPEFNFSKELNTCLYRAVQISRVPGNSYKLYFIKDVYKNKQLVAYLVFSNYPERGIDKDYLEGTPYKEYKSFERKYFK